MALTKIDDRGLKTPIDLLDNEKIRLGTGSDLQIHHHSSGYSVIQNASGAGVLYIQADGNVHITDSNNDETFAKFIDNGTVELYYDNSKKFETTTNGITVTGSVEPTGHVKLDDNTYLYLGTGDDFIIGHQPDESPARHLFRSTDGATRIEFQGGSEKMAIMTPQGAVDLYYDNSKKFETTTAGVTVTGTVSDSKGDLRKIPQNHQANAYTLVAADAGKHILADANVTWTDNTFAAGDAVTIVNASGGDITITKGTTMWNTADGNNDNRTLASKGMATLLFASGTVAYISGAGLS